MPNVKFDSGRGLGVFNTEVTSMSGSAETTLFSQTIEAGKMGTNKVVEFELISSITTVLTAPTLTIKVYLGASVFTLAAGIGLTISQTGVPFIIKGKIVAMGSPSVQYVYAEIRQVSNTLPLVLSGSASLAGADWAVNTAVDQLFKITGQFGANLAGNTIQTKLGSLLLS